MTGWILLTATLAGVNLVRAWRHGLVLASVTLAALALLAGFGGIQVEGWPAFAAALLGGGVAILLWWRAPRRGGWHALALTALTAAAVLQLLSMQVSSPAAAGVWPWLVALLLLADALRGGLRVRRVLPARHLGQRARGDDHRGSLGAPRRRPPVRCAITDSRRDAPRDRIVFPSGQRALVT